MPNFDAFGVKTKADEIVHSDKSKVEDARDLFLEEIMDWSDYYVENEKNISTEEIKSVFDSITSLWIYYANFEIALHQYKKAVDVFEKAIIDPIVCKSVVIYQTYAKFCVDRKKPGNAQSAYIKGLCAGLCGTDNSKLWKELLSLMHTVNKSTNLTLVQLYEAVRKQAGVDETLLAVPQEARAIEPSATASDSAIITAPAGGGRVTRSRANSVIATEQQQAAAVTMAVDANESKEMEVDSALPLATTAAATISDPTSTDAIVPSSAPSAVTTTDATAMDVDSEQSAATAAAETLEQQPERRYAAPDDLDDISGYTPEQLIRTFVARPPMLFTALHKEPTASGIAALFAEAGNPAVAELESFLGISLSNLPDRTPNMHTETIDYAAWTEVDRLLDLLEGMWAAQALKERHFDSWITDLRTMHIEQETALVESFIDTDSPAMADKSVEEKAGIKKRQHGELMNFRNHCAVQQELLHAIINKAQFTLLIEQQIQLVQIGFPRFTLNCIDSLQSYIKKRKNISNAGKNEYDAPLIRQVAAQRELLCAFLSVRLLTVSQERSRAAQCGKTKLSRAQSIDQESEVAGDLNYFDAEAKKRRKRRRLIMAHHSDSYSHSGVSSYSTHDTPGGAPFHPAEGAVHGNVANQPYSSALGNHYSGTQQQHQHPTQQQHQYMYTSGVPTPAGGSARATAPGRAGGASAVPLPRISAPVTLTPEQAQNNPALPLLNKLAALIKK